MRGALPSGLLLGLRVRRGWTQELLSDRSGISVRTIRNLEGGQVAYPRRTTVRLLLAALGEDAEAALAPEPEPPRGPHWHGGRPPLTSLLGRGAELERLARLLERHPVLVLTGPGGVGKSRLALALAEASGPAFPGGVRVVELGRLAQEPADGDAEPGPALDALTTALGEAHEGPPLVVLDHTEHLPRTAGTLAEVLLRSRPGARLVITTRRPPALGAARIWEVEPLPLPIAADLFFERVGDNAPALDPGRDRPQVLRLVEQLDGLPRLVELAAHRLRVVSLATLSAGPGALELLEAADPAALPHQRSLRASLQWSWDLLSAEQRRFLLRMAALPEDAFAGGTAAGRPLDPQTAGLLAGLADASLLQLRHGAEYEYRMMRHVRLFLQASAPAAGAAAVRPLPLRRGGVRGARPVADRTGGGG